MKIFLYIFLFLIVILFIFLINQSLFFITKYLIFWSLSALYCQKAIFCYNSKYYIHNCAI